MIAINLNQNRKRKKGESDMNPTEEFIAELVKLLDKHEEVTGTYIGTIKIVRYLDKQVSQPRGKSLIIDIQLEIA